jgi:hypothetical protein
VGVVIAVALCLLPIARMALLVADASPLHYADYWLLVDEYTYDDGGLRVAGLFDFDVQNHPVVLPMLVYWLDFQLFAGSNVALGGFVILLGVALVGTVGLFVQRSPLPLTARLAILVLSASLLFSPNGAWNYVKSMSGTAWLGANLVALLAIYLRSRDRHVAAFAAASVAVITYATGLVGWTGVIATGLCRRPPRTWWRELPYVAGFAVSYRFYQEVQTTGLGADLPVPSPPDLLRGTARLFGVPLGLEGAPATAVGFAALAAIVGLVAWSALRGPTPGAALWAGVATFGMTATATLAAGRAVFVDSSQNRYSSVPAIAMIGLAGLVGVAFASRQADDPTGPRWPGWLPATALCSVLAVLALLAGGDHVADMRRQVHEQQLREVALRLDLADGTTRLAGSKTSVTDLLRANHQHPFVDGWDLDCGLLGERLDLAVTVPMAPTAGTVTDARVVERAVELTGRLEHPDRTRCVVVADHDGTVIGAGTIGYASGSTVADGFVVLAPTDAEAYRVVAVDDDGEHLLVDAREPSAVVGLAP